MCVICSQRTPQQADIWVTFWVCLCPCFLNINTILLFCTNSQRQILVETYLAINLFLTLIFALLLAL